MVFIFIFHENDSELFMAFPAKFALLYRGMGTIGRGMQGRDGSFEVIIWDGFEVENWWV